MMADTLTSKSADRDLKLIPTPTGPLCVPQRDDSNATARLSVVLPTFNEAQNIEPMIGTVTEILERSQIAYELIVVDDDSPDGTWSRALSLSASLPRLRVMRRTNERGLATAVIRGWQASCGDILGVLDADLQHPPETIPKLWSQIEAGVDLAVGSRHVPGGGVSNWSLRRRFISRTAQGIGLMVLPEVLRRLADPMSGYLLVRRAKLAGVTLNPVGYKILIEILGRSEIETISEVGYVFQERMGNQSKVTWRSYRDYLLHLGILRFRRVSPLERIAKRSTRE
jgi:dolichol-phosphate mannosyltransferase